MSSTAWASLRSLRSISGWTNSGKFMSPVYWSKQEGAGTGDIWWTSVKFLIELPAFLSVAEPRATPSFATA